MLTDRLTRKGPRVGPPCLQTTTSAALPRQVPAPHLDWHFRFPSAKVEAGSSL